MLHTTHPSYPPSDVLELQANHRHSETYETLTGETELAVEKTPTKKRKGSVNGVSGCAGGGEKRRGGGGDVAAGDDLRNYSYEGEGSSPGSLSSCKCVCLCWEEERVASRERMEGKER